MTELGRVLFSNGGWYPEDAQWAVDGLEEIAEAIAKLRGLDPEGFRTTLTSNSGEEEYVNKIFAMRSYCWCEGEGDHSDGCPPNFEFYRSGITISWYKHSNRGITANIERPENWKLIVNECIESIGDGNDQ